MIKVMTCQGVFNIYKSETPNKFLTKQILIV